MFLHHKFQPLSKCLTHSFRLHLGVYQLVSLPPSPGLLLLRLCFISILSPHRPLHLQQLPNCSSRPQFSFHLPPPRRDVTFRAISQSSPARTFPTFFFSFIHSAVTLAPHDRHSLTAPHITWFCFLLVKCYPRAART